MFKPALFTLLILPSLPAHALDTHPLPPEQLLTLGTKLAAHAGSNQWQQLWQRTRAAGHLQPEPGRAYFTLSQAQLPQLARETLTKADQVEAQNNTFALYRRAFPGQVVGMLDEQPLNASASSSTGAACPRTWPTPPMPISAAQAWCRATPALEGTGTLTARGKATS